MHLDTLAVHAGMEDLAAQGLHVPPIDLSTTNPLPDLELGGASYDALATGGVLPEGGSAVYQRLWNPTVARFEAALAALEGTSAAVAFGSGMAALSAVLLATVQAGRPHVVALRPLYGGTDHVLDSGLLGTSVTWVSSVAEVAAAARPDTGLVVLETPANPSLETVDVAAVVRAASGVPVLVDSTFATPVLQTPAADGAALVLHSATKYLGGHGDVMGGVVACGDDWAARLRSVRAVTGALLHPWAAYLLHRGLRTLPLRVRAAQATAAALVPVLAAHPVVADVRYPGSGSVLALTVEGGYDAARTFVQSCRLVTHAVSLGGVDTLVQHPASLTHRPVAAEAKPDAGLVRLAVGLEHVEDLAADLSAALDVVAVRHLDALLAGR